MGINARDQKIQLESILHNKNLPQMLKITYRYFLINNDIYNIICYLSSWAQLQL